MRGETGYHGDTLDHGTARGRGRSFIKQAAKELAVKEESDPARGGQAVDAGLEDLQRERIEKTLTPPEEESEMTAEDKSAAMELLRDPRLLDRVLADFARAAWWARRRTRRSSYLAAVSRLLKKPLAIVVQSSSSAGKSSLMEAVLDFMPEEQRESYTAMTGQALFYMGAEKSEAQNPRHRGSSKGASRAAYPLKLLQSEGRLKIASHRQRPGERQARDARVHGRRAGDDLPDHDGAGGGRGAAEPLHRARR